MSVLLYLVIAFGTIGLQLLRAQILPTDLPDGVYYSGCYNTTLNFTLLEVPLGVVTSATNCIERGQKTNLAFAAVTDGWQCFAGNRLEGNSARVDDALCQGHCQNRAETCGTKTAAQVYTLRGANGPTDLPEENDLLPGDATYYGCFQDTDDARALHVQLHNVTTVQECMQAALAYQYTHFCIHHKDAYAGLEGGNECFVGYTIENNATQKEDSACAANKCQGDAQEDCGDQDAVSIYYIPKVLEH